VIWLRRRGLLRFRRRACWQWNFWFWHW